MNKIDMPIPPDQDTSEYWSKANDIAGAMNLLSGLLLQDDKLTRGQYKNIGDVFGALGESLNYLSIEIKSHAEGMGIYE